jgi:hypothetical protein
VIVIAKGVGRLANRLLLFAHFIGAATEHGFAVANPAFRQYAKYFPRTARDLLCRFPSGRALWAPPGSRKLLYQATLWTAGMLRGLQRIGRDVGLIRLRRDQRLDLDGRAFLDAVGRYRLLFVQDWYFRSLVDCERHGDAIRDYLTPWDHHLARSRASLEPARRRGRFVIGVHVRLGDYRGFLGGRFYYSHAQYGALMARAEAAFPSENVSFLVCSNEPVPRDAFPGLDVLHGPGHEVEDLYALAACDRLIGPPSTYSAWASFYGSVPIYQVEDATSPVEAAAFEVDRTLCSVRFASSPRVSHADSVRQ